MATKRDIYQEVTDRIVAALEEGVAPWVKPWNAKGVGFPRNGVTKRQYSGMNVILCYVSGFSSPDWFTYNQASKLGAQVRKGEKGTTLVFWKFIEDKKDPNNKIPLLRHFTVFNRHQIDGLPEEEAVPEVPVEVESFREHVRGLGMTLRDGGDSAHYSPKHDYVQMPHATDFVDEGAYLSTLFHEAGHWTGHASRLDRDMSGSFGTEGYAFEELVAEIASAFLCAENGVAGRLQHSEYIGHWIRKLKEDKKMIFKASTAAKKAAELLSPVVGEEEVVEEAA